MSKEDLNNTKRLIEILNRLLLMTQFMESMKFKYKMTEERYQYLNSLSIKEYDKETSEKEQEEFCKYQRKYHPDEVAYYQTHNPD